MEKVSGRALKVAGIMGPGSRASSMDRVFSPGRMENLIKVRGKEDTSTAPAQ
ncbi:MAG: hypothetical protein R6U19_10795 [Bacteroidales bacterium]